MFGRLDHCTSKFLWKYNCSEYVMMQTSSKWITCSVSRKVHFNDTSSSQSIFVACHLHAENCVAQNKNRYVLGYLMWRVLTGRNKKITLSFMCVGHTRCMVDGDLGLIKKLYRSSDVDTVWQLSDIVSDSSKTNVTQLYPWEWREWDAFESFHFRRDGWQCARRKRFPFSKNE